MARPPSPNRAIIEAALQAGARGPAAVARITGLNYYTVASLLSAARNLKSIAPHSDHRLNPESRRQIGRAIDGGERCQRCWLTIPCLHTAGPPVAIIGEKGAWSRRRRDRG